jgi:GST-like protein
MIELYALTSPNVRKVFIMLEEIGLPYKPIPVDVWKGEQYKPEFLCINPNNRIPVIVDHEGPGGKPYTVIESGAILMYLGDKTGQFFPTDTAKRYEVVQWLMWQMASVGPMFGQFTHFHNYAPPGNDYSRSRYTTEVKRLYGVLETRLGQKAHVGGDDYSIADMAVFPWTRNHATHGIKLVDHPNFARWYKAIESRPAVQRAMAKVDAIKSSKDVATDEDKDLFFGRGKYARA